MMTENFKPFFEGRPARTNVAPNFAFRHSQNFRRRLGEIFGGDQAQSDADFIHWLLAHHFARRIWRDGENGKAHFDQKKVSPAFGIALLGRCSLRRFRLCFRFALFRLAGNDFPAIGRDKKLV